MISRRSFVAGLGAAVTGSAAKPGVSPLGIEIYSLRREMAKDIPGTLAMIRRLGFQEVEVPGLYNLSAKDFRAQLDKADLRCTAMVAKEAQLRDAIGQVAEDAHTLGAQYVLFPWIAHNRETGFTLADCLKGADALNKWGHKLKANGLEFCYHPHGFEFQPHEDGTLFDTLMRITDASLVNYQLDVFWVVWPGQDPVALMQRYPKRFPLMHVKDLGKGFHGNLTGHAPEETSVAIGAGVIDFPAIFHEARKIGVRRYYLEDEAPNAAENIPVSLRYLKTVN